VIQLNPEKHATAKLASAKVLAEWLAGPEGQREIGAMVLGGEQLFHPDADAPVRSGS
jgi:tungstate transport system substrate-binding protein